MPQLDLAGSGTNHNDILGVTMSGLEAGFKVFHIAAFDLELCAPDILASEVLNDPRLKDFDHIPVRERNQIVGVLQRGSVKRAGSDWTGECWFPRKNLFQNSCLR